MQPHPEHGYDQSDDSSRIIYLGDVRRRKSRAARRLPDRHYLAALGTVAVVCWLVWLTVLLTVPPSKLLTYVAFLAPLTVAVAATGSLIAYGVESRLDPFPEIGRSVRRGVLLALVVSVNLALLGAHRWTPPAFLIMAAVAVFTDLARGHQFR